MRNGSIYIVLFDTKDKFYIVFVYAKFFLSK